MFLRETFLFLESTRGGERPTPHTPHALLLSLRKMVVSLPRRGGGRGGRGRGRGGTPFRDRERNPRLVSNSSNSNITLAVSVSCLPPAPWQPSSLPLHHCCRRPLSCSPRRHPPSLYIRMTLLPRRSVLNQIHFLVGLLPTMLSQN